MGWRALPDGDGKITRDDFLGVVAEAETHVSLARYRLEDVFNDDPDAINRDALDDTEQALHDKATRALCALKRRAAMPAMMKIATDVAEADKQAAKDEEETQKATYSLEVDRLVEHYKAPLYTFIREHPQTESIRLAMAILEVAGLEEQVPTLLGVLSGELNTCNTHGYNRGSESGHPVHLCPRCEGEGCLTGLPWMSNTCNRCKGWGYLLQSGEPIDEEESLSLKGRQARNKGEPWTLADEAVESGYKSLEDALEDDWYAPFGIWPEPAGSSSDIST